MNWRVLDIPLPSCYNRVVYTIRQYLVLSLSIVLEILREIKPRAETLRTSPRN